MNARDDVVRAADVSYEIHCFVRNRVVALIGCASACDVVITSVDMRERERE